MATKKGVKIVEELNGVYKRFLEMVDEKEKIALKCIQDGKMYEEAMMIAEDTVNKKYGIQ